MGTSHIYSSENSPQSNLWLMVEGVAHRARHVTRCNVLVESWSRDVPLSNLAVAVGITRRIFSSSENSSQGNRVCFSDRGNSGPVSDTKRKRIPLHILLTPAMNVSRCLNSDPHSWSHSSQKISCGFMSGLNDAVANRLRDNGRRGPCVGRKTTPPSTDRGGGKGRRVSFSFVDCFSLPFSFFFTSKFVGPCRFYRRRHRVRILRDEKR